MLGLLSIDETSTYLPPIWEATLPYSFCAATIRMMPLPPPVVADPAEPHADRVVAEMARAAPRTTMRDGDGRFWAGTVGLGIPLT